MNFIMGAPPKAWFDKTATAVKDSLKANHPEYSSEVLEQKARQLVADAWYNRLSPEEREKISSKHAASLYTSEELAAYNSSVESMEREAKEMAMAAELATKAEVDGIPIHDGMNRSEASAATFSTTDSILHMPAFKSFYTATPKPGFESEAGPIIIKSVILEEGLNVNGWRVVEGQFAKIAEQGKLGKHLRVNHGKDVQDVIGKSYSASVVQGKDLSLFLGRTIDGINPEGKYIVAEFEASPQDRQVRTNILQGYIDTGSIGLDAAAYCDACSKPVEMDATGNMRRTCRHLDAGVKLDNVEWKEYSYVAEPAYDHTKAFPTFSASTSVRIQHSSLSDSKPDDTVVMSTNPATDNVPAANVSVEATAAKGAEAEEMISKSTHDAIMKAYQQGMRDGEKMSAAKASAGQGDHPDDCDCDNCTASKKASKKAGAEAKKFEQGDDPERGVAPTKKAYRTDQIGKVVSDAKPNPRLIAKEDLMNKIFHPQQYYLQNDPSLREVFTASRKAAAERGISLSAQEIE